MRLGIDLDGVCYDFASSVRAYLVHAGIRFQHQCPEPTRWEFYEDWGLSLDEFLTTCHRGVEAGIIFTHGDPFEGTVEALRAMRDAGHTLHIVTDRSFGRSGASPAATSAWLDLHGIPFDSLTFSADKTLLRLDAMVDDKPSNYAALVDAGVDAYLFTRAWNEHVEDAQRVSSLAEFAEAVS